MPKISTVQFNSISVFYNEYIIRNLFWTKGIARLGNIYITPHNDPNLEYYDPLFQYYATQSVCVEIEEFCDSEAAWKFICDLNEGHAYIITSFANYIVCEPIYEDEPVVVDSDEKDETISNLALSLSKEGELLFNTLTPMQQKLFTDLFEDDAKHPLSPYQITEKDMSPFQQKLFIDLFTDLFNE